MTLRIEIVVGSLQIGGSERQAVLLARELYARGHTVSVLSVIDGGPLEAVLEGAGIPYRIMGLQSLVGRDEHGNRTVRGTVANLRRVAALRGEFRRRRVDAVHAFLLWPSVLSLLPAWAARVPVRISARRNLGTDVAGKRFPVLERILGWISTTVTANSGAVADAIVAQGTPADRVEVIYNGIDPFDQAGAVEDQPPKAVVVANLIHYKGHRDLIEALASMDRRPIEVDLLGDGPERPALEAQVAEAGLTDVVRFQGQVADVAGWLREAQLAIHPAHEEGFPNAVLEAMASGLPVIATAVGGTVEIVHDGETGLLVPPSDPPALAAAIDRLAADPELRSRLGRAARQEILTRFSWERCVEAHEALYRR